MKLLKVIYHTAALALLLAIAVSAGSLAQDTGDVTATSPTAFPAISLPPLYEDGEGFNSEYFAGQEVTVVNFFASWCLPCRVEHPYLVDLSRRGVPVVGINYMDKADDALQYLAATGNPYQRIGVDPGTAFDATLQVYDIPQTILVDRQGKILFRYVGRLEPPVLEQSIYPLVFASAGASAEALKYTSGSSTMSGMIIALIVLVVSAILFFVLLRRGKTAGSGIILKAASITGIVLPALYIAVAMMAEPESTPPMDIDDIYASLDQFLEAEQAQPQAPPASDMSMEGVTARLAERLRDNPDNIAGWTLLARSYASTGRLDKAIETYQVAISHAPNDIDLAAGYGEMLIDVARGEVTENAHDVFSEVARRQPGHPAAEYYLALADMQAGDAQAAYDRWRQLAMTGAATDAPWLAAVQQQLDHAAIGLGIEAQQFVVATDTAPIASEALSPKGSEGKNAVTDEANATPEADLAFIQSMVTGLAARLESEPDNLDGWLQLGRSYGVLGDWREAAGAYGHAAALSPDNSEIIALWNAALARAGN